MNSNEISKGIIKAIATLAGICLMLYFIYLIKSLIIYIVIAVILSLIAKPFINFFINKLKFKKLLAIIITMVFFISLITGVLVLFVPLIYEQSKNLSILDVSSLSKNISDLYNVITKWLIKHDITFSTDIFKSVIDKVNTLIPNIIDGLFGTIKNLSIGILSVLFISFFFMKDSRLFNQIIITPINSKHQKRVGNSLTKIKQLLSRYFIGLCIQITIVFCLYTILLSVVGISNGVTIALLCALFNLVPFVGPIISGFLMIILCMTSNLEYNFNDVILPKTIAVGIGFIVIQLIDAFITQPTVFSNSVKSHPLEIFMVIIINGLIFGVLGMIVAVPMYTCIRVIAKEFLSENNIVKKLTNKL